MFFRCILLHYELQTSVPLGGIVGVTKNMYVYELYKGDELKDILICWSGIGFPREFEFGVLRFQISHILGQKLIKNP